MMPPMAVETMSSTRVKPRADRHLDKCEMGEITRAIYHKYLHEDICKIVQKIEKIGGA
jgi:hypothetical protein